MSNPLYCVRYGVGKIVHRINTPLVPRPVMRNVRYSVNYGIAHIDVRGSHIYFRPQSLCAVGIYSLFHFAEEL